MLTFVPDQDERDLAAVDGMNVFAAAIILSKNSLDEFLDKLPEQRSEDFGNLIGRARIVCLSLIKPVLLD